MKKILLLTIFITSLFGDAKTYIGTNYEILNEKFFGGSDISTKTDAARIKIGYGIRDSYAIELALEYIRNKDNIFSKAGDNDGDKLGINVELIKAFDLDIYVNPFFKAGFGVGTFNVTQSGTNIYENDIDINRLSYGLFSVGSGIFIPINEHYDIEVGYEYRYISYENLDATTDSDRGAIFESNMNVAYIGLNIRF